MGGFALICVWIVVNFFLSAMYKSVLVSQLTKPEDPKQVDSLADMLDVFRDMDIAVIGPSVVSNHLKSNALFPEFEEAGRFQMFPFNDMVENVEKLKGKEIVMTFPDEAFLTKRLKAYNRLSPCKLFREDFHVSEQTIGRMMLAPIVRRGYNHTDLVKDVTLKLFEAGLDRVPNPGFEYEEKVVSSCDVDKRLKNVEDVIKRPCLHNTLGKKLSIYEVRQIIYTYLFGMSVASVVFVIELLCGTMAESSTKLRRGQTSSFYHGS